MKSQQKENGKQARTGATIGKKGSAPRWGNIGGKAGSARDGYQKPLWGVGGRYTIVGLALVVLYVVLIATSTDSSRPLLEGIAILSLFAVGTNILVGQLGLLSFGQAAFYGLGGYSFGILLEHRIEWVIALLGSIVLCGVIGFAMGGLLLRTRKLYFALASLAISEIAYTFAYTETGITGGNNGLFGVSVPSWLAGGESQVVFIVGISIVGIAIATYMDRSKIGRIFHAVRENRVRVASIGIVPFWWELVGFVIAAVLCGAAGCLGFLWVGGISPGSADWSESAIPVVAVIIGGMYSSVGPIVGATLYEIVYTKLTSGTQDWELIFGIVLVGIVLLAPEGLVGLGIRMDKWVFKNERKHGLGILIKTMRRGSRISQKT